MSSPPEEVDFETDTVATERELVVGGLGRLALLVISDANVITHPLPDSGDVVIGRSSACDIQLQDASISRRHARLRLGPTLLVEDLGSANGLRVRGARVGKGQTVTLAADEPFELGAVMLLVQNRAQTIQLRRIWAHDYFEGRLAEECQRAERAGNSFVLLRIHCDKAVATNVVPEVFGQVLRSFDVFGLYSPGEYEVLLVDTIRQDAEIPLRRVTAELALRGVPIRTGIACFPQDGRDPDSLVARASRDALGVSASVASPPPTLPREGSIQHLHKLVERVAAGMVSVLILGETGVGKEVLAETVHRLSPRAKQPFLRLNCAALSGSLLESELFGHERGSFTGAVQAKEGLLETAQGGTIFIDEVGELPMSMQVKLLRVLEERQVLRVGSLRPRTIDVRFVAATNRDLEAEIARGTFRQDLFFRLDGVSLVIPPLRQRTDEIPSLIASFLPQACREAGRSDQPSVSADALAVLQQYSWPGNIRELRNAIQRAVLLCGPTIEREHLPIMKMLATFTTSRGSFGPSETPQAERPRAWSEDETSPDVATRSDAPPVPAAAAPAAVTPPASPVRARDAVATPSPLRDEMKQLERQRILQVLSQCGGNQTEAARLLGLSRRTLINRLEQFDIQRPRKR